VRSDQSLTDWVVLGIVAEGPTHGWAVTRELAPDGPLGRIWTVRRPLVYRALAALEERGSIEACGEEQSERGPVRTLVRTTAAGRGALRHWLGAPVAHVRDVRTAFLIKVTLLERSGRPIDDLVQRQLDELQSVFDAIRRDRSPDALQRWRRESARSVERFLRSLLRG
jgi:DNA-binding PadR family transcriptional regulator